MSSKTNMAEVPWVDVKDVCHMYGYTYLTAKGKILKNEFPVKTYKAGKLHVIDRDVHEEYFRLQKEAGLLALKTTNS